MRPEVLEACPDTVELALERKHPVPIGGMCKLVGLCDVPHRDPEQPMRVLQSENPVVHRHEEAEPDQQERARKLNCGAGVDLTASELGR